MSMALKIGRAQVGAVSGGAFIPRSQFIGDPGLFGFLGDIARKAAGAVGGILTGISGQAQPTIFSRPPILTTPSILPIIQQFPAAPQAGPSPLQRLGQQIIPGGKTGFEQNGAARPAGTHLNKSDYWLKDGTFVPAGSRFVSNRRMNPLNPRAASRAISRVERGKKATKAFDRITVRCKRCCKAACVCK